MSSSITQVQQHPDSSIGVQPYSNSRFNWLGKLQLVMFTLAASSALLFTGCQKNLKVTPDAQTNLTLTQQKITLPNTVNPFSLRNVQKAKITLAANSSFKKSNSTTSLTGNEPQFVYFKFDPTNISGELVKAFDEDTTVQLLSFPFANPAVYTDSLGLDSAKLEQLNDGSVYGVINMGNPILQTLATSISTIQTQFLDTLIKIPEEDTTTLFQAFREAGYSEEQLDLFRLCLFKRPHGFVRYLDRQLNNGNGQLEPVRSIGVWALLFGIPMKAFTDDNGYYQIPWRFSVPTIMGTMAKNQRVNVKPFDTHGGWRITALIQALVVGPVDIIGFRTSCQMRNDINIHLTAHRQNRLWAQILNNYAFNEDYSNNEGINTAPKGMICYAHWGGALPFGSASTPLMGHLTYGTLTLEAVLNNVMGGNVNIPRDYPNLFNAMTGIMPDMTVKVSAQSEPQFYNSRLAQTLFHELGHASQYFKVGQAWHYRLMQESVRVRLSGGDYGIPGEGDWGITQVAESWAEFIGTEHARRRYGQFGFKTSAMLGTINFTTFNQEREDFFFSNWIPSGLYYDLMDNVNLRNETWDNVGSVTIEEMYRVFDPYSTSMCLYYQQFVGTYRNRDTPATFALFSQYPNIICF